MIRDYHAEAMAVIEAEDHIEELRERDRRAGLYIALNAHRRRMPRLERFGLELIGIGVLALAFIQLSRWGLG